MLHVYKNRVQQEYLFSFCVISLEMDGIMFVNSPSSSSFSMVVVSRRLANFIFAMQHLFKFIGNWFAFSRELRRKTTMTFRSTVQIFECMYLHVWLKSITRHICYQWKQPMSGKLSWKFSVGKVTVKPLVGDRSRYWFQS